MKLLTLTIARLTSTVPRGPVQSSLSSSTHEAHKVQCQSAAKQSLVFCSCSLVAFTLICGSCQKLVSMASNRLRIALLQPQWNASQWPSRSWGSMQQCLLQWKLGPLRARQCLAARHHVHVLCCLRDVLFAGSWWRSQLYLAALHRLQQQCN